MLGWLDEQPREKLFLTAISLAELKQGAALTSQGKRKVSIESAIHELTTKFLVTSILPFNEDAATTYAEIVVRAKEKRYTVPLADGLIAAIALAKGFAVATRDVKPFLAAGVPVINPWEE